jgi:hypothetical protein
LKRIQNITSEPIQRHTVLLPDGEITLTLRFYPRTQIWAMDAEYRGWAVYGLKMSLSVLHMLSQNQPFDFTVIDNSNSGIDPFQRNDFSSGRCELIMLERDEIRQIRGARVDA